MANKRSHQGGTTALVIVLTLVIIFVGVGFFAWMKIIGGGKELQHATDAGNLNVAKQALKDPSVSLQGTSESNEFGDLTDPSNGQVDLLAFDRLVGKATLVALNAAAENTPTARQHAQTVLGMVQGDSGIGPRLAQKLSQHSNLAQHFSNVAATNSTRMLHSDGQIQADSEETAVSYMAVGKASNVYLSGNQMPPEVQSFLSDSNNVITKNNKQYLTGYQGLHTGLAGVSPQAVPMRPGEQPHLVDLDDFQAANQSPLPGGNGSLIPPNAFRSGGLGLEGNATNQNLKMRSSAIVGTLNQDFPVSIPRGYIILDNSGSLDFSGQIGGAQTALAKVLMRPSYVGLVTGAPGVGDVFGKTSSVENVNAFVQAHKSDPSPPPVPSNLLSAIDQPQNMTSAQAYTAFNNNPAVHECDNTNSITGGSTPKDVACQQKFNDFLNFYGSQVPGENVSASGIMAVEAFKCKVLEVRSAVGDSGCGAANFQPEACTGLKKFNIAGGINGTACLPCNFSSPGNVSELLAESSASSVAAQLMVRMYQIKPTATESEVTNVLNTVVPFGTTSYIYLQGGPTGNLVLSSTPPSFPISVGLSPDGDPQNFEVGPVNLNGKIVNVPECEGYPNPWDCPALPATGRNKIVWTPSSGFNNLLGVLRFQNCASGGGEWCCPC